MNFTTALAQAFAFSAAGFASVGSEMATTKLAPVIALSHGGGPLPVLGDPGHASIAASLRTRVPQILGLDSPSPPRAIVLVTAHWSTSTPAVSASASHSLLYDYGGFPREAYRLTYAAPGSPSVASEVLAALEAEGVGPAKGDPFRGWDHGVFIPMLLVRPQADIPIVQVSVLADEDPDRHLRVGRALRSLRQQNVAIVGSGFASLHDTRGMVRLMTGGVTDAEKTALRARATDWNDAVTAAATDAGEEARWRGMRAWRDMPHSREMHPPAAGGEHFMPLIVCAGAAVDGEEGGVYKDDFLGLDIFTYYWGAAEKV